MIVFITIVFLDFILDILVINYNRDTSKLRLTIRNNIYRIVAYLVAIIIVVQLDKLLGNTSIFKDSLITFTIASEMLIMIDNLNQLGVPFPKRVKEALEVLRKNKNGN